MIPLPRAAPSTDYLAAMSGGKAKVVMVAGTKPAPEKPLTKEEAQARMDSLKPMLDKLGLAGQQSTPAYKNWKAQFDDAANQLRALNGGK